MCSLPFESLEYALAQLPAGTLAKLCLTDDPSVWATRAIQREWLYRTAQLAPAGQALDIGTGWGLSSLIIAAARPEPLLSIDINPDARICANELAMHLGLRVDYQTRDIFQILPTLPHNFGFILIDGLHSYRAERFAYDFARQNDATVVIDDVNQLHPDSYRLSTRTWVGRQIARWQYLFEVLGRVFNDGGTPRLYRELGFPEVHHGRWIVLRGAR
jgi:hypothetical protein